MIRSLFNKDYAWIIHDSSESVKAAKPIPGIAASYGRKKTAGIRRFLKGQRAVR
jgi:hypothetical protein